MFAERRGFVSVGEWKRDVYARLVEERLVRERRLVQRAGLLPCVLRTARPWNCRDSLKLQRSNSSNLL